MFIVSIEQFPDALLLLDVHIFNDIDRRLVLEVIEIGRYGLTRNFKNLLQLRNGGVSLEDGPLHDHLG